MTTRRPHFGTAIVVAIALAFILYKTNLLHAGSSRDTFKSNIFQTEKSVDKYDLKLKDNGIFGYKAADFQDPILGEASRQALLIVDEQDVHVPSKITDTWLFNLKVFSKYQDVEFYGTGIYTVDLSKLTKDDITVDPENHTVQIMIPYPELHEVTFDPSRTVVGDVQRKWLGFGDITLNEKQQKEFETTAINKLTDHLNESDCFDRAEDYARLSAEDVFRPVVDSVASGWSVAISVSPK